MDSEDQPNHRRNQCMDWITWFTRRRNQSTRPYRPNPSDTQGQRINLLINGGTPFIQFNSPQGSNNTTATSGDPAAFNTLFKHTCPKAFHNADEFDEFKCHPGTRTAVLKVLMDFARGTELPFITWLNGPAGAGKTAIARSTSDECEEANLLAASFFFWRNDANRSDEKLMIPTLAYQLALNIPLLRPFIERKIADDPAIFSKTLKRQLNALILVPLQQMRDSHPHINIQSLPRQIIIDGLDECGGQSVNRIERQERALEILRHLASQQEIFPFRILIVSRTEAHIRRRFEEHDLQSLTHSLLLDHSFTPENDIYVYVTHEFLWIVEKHPDRHFLLPGWPGGDIIQKIVQKSSGQFIYAVTVMKYIRSELHRPHMRLMAIQGIGRKPAASLGESPFNTIDSLYTHILSTAADAPTALKTLVLHFVYSRGNSLFMSAAISNPRSTALFYCVKSDFVCLRLASMEEAMELELGVITHSVSHFKPLFELQPASFTFPWRDLINFHHASFPDFLLNEDRSREWYIDVGLHASAFALMNLMSFERAKTEETQQEWFHLMVLAIICSSRSDLLDEAISTKWLQLTDYPPGHLFLEKTLFGREYCDILLHAISKYYHEDQMYIAQRFYMGMSKVFEPIIQMYQTDYILLSLLLCWSVGKETYTSHDRFRMLAEVCRRWMIDFITRRTHLLEIDRRALSLVRLLRADGDTSTIQTEQRWLAGFVVFYMPPQRDVAMRSVVLLLQIILDECIHPRGSPRTAVDRLSHYEHWPTSSHPSFIGYIVSKLSSPSSEVAELLEALRKHEIEGNFKTDPIIQKYLDSCAHLSRSGAAPDLSFVQKEGPS